MYCSPFSEIAWLTCSSKTVCPIRFRPTYGYLYALKAWVILKENEAETALWIISRFHKDSIHMNMARIFVSPRHKLLS